MKTLSELGISPAPWKICEGELERWIEDSDGILVAELGMKNNATRRANLWLFLAAPDLYEALCRCRRSFKSISDDRNTRASLCILKELCRHEIEAIEAALAKASGESEVAK